MREEERERLGKVVKLAKHGIGGERDSAMNILRKLCEKYKLDIEEVLGNAEEMKKREFTIRYKTALEKKVLMQVVAKYAQSKEFWNYRFENIISFESTLEQYIEIQNAFDVLIRLFRQERKRYEKAFYFGFLEKHDLYYKGPDNDTDESKISDEERDLRHVGAKMASDMKDAEINKRLGNVEKAQ